MHYMRTNSCVSNNGAYEQVFCSSGSDSIEGTNPAISGLNNTGFFTTSKYNTAKNCDSYAQSITYQLGVCMATSLTSSQMYYNYSVFPSQNLFSLSYAEYNDMKCTVLAENFPTTTNYTTECTFASRSYTKYSYSPEFEKQSNGLVAA
jgi:hypothetical protein